jgi:hypothetical protein
MLYEQLCKIYRDKLFLSAEFPFDEYYPLIKRFILEEVARGSNYLNPYRFSYAYGFNTKRIIRLFLALSDNDRIFKKFCHYECECHESSIVAYEQIYNFECPNCGDSLSDSEDLMNNMQHVKLLFKIDDEIKQGAKNDLKVPSPSDNIREITNTSGGDFQNVSLVDAIEANVLDDQPPVSTDITEFERRMLLLLSHGLGGV